MSSSRGMNVWWTIVISQGSTSDNLLAHKFVSFQPVGPPCHVHFSHTIHTVWVCVQIRLFIMFI